MTCTQVVGSNPTEGSSFFFEDDCLGICIVLLFIVFLLIVSWSYYHDCINHLLGLYRGVQHCGTIYKTVHIHVHCTFCVHVQCTCIYTLYMYMYICILCVGLHSQVWSWECKAGQTGSE